MRKYTKPEFVVEEFATNEYVAACGSEITKIPEQTVDCIATCSTTVFGSGTCTNVATVVTVDKTRYYSDTKTAATDIFDGTLNNGDMANKSSATQTGNYTYCVTAGTKYVVWKAYTDEGIYASHANTYTSVTETIQKS